MKSVPFWAGEHNVAQLMGPVSSIYGNPLRRATCLVLCAVTESQHRGERPRSAKTGTGKRAAVNVWAGLVGRREGTGSGRADMERRGLSRAEVEKTTLLAGDVLEYGGFYLGAMEGEKARRKRGGDPFRILQHPERSQWRP